MSEVVWYVSEVGTCSEVDTCSSFKYVYLRNQGEISQFHKQWRGHKGVVVIAQAHTDLVVVPGGMLKPHDISAKKPLTGHLKKEYIVTIPITTYCLRTFHCHFVIMHQQPELAGGISSIESSWKRIE